MHYMSTFAKVRRLFHRDNLSISEIQRRTSLSRNTIKTWLKETSPDSHKYPKRPKVNGKLTPFVPALLLALEADSRRGVDLFVTADIIIRLFFSKWNDILWQCNFFDIRL